MGPEASLVKPRFARGCRCFAVIIDGAIAGYGWLSTGPEWIGELQLEIRPRQGEAYIWNCVTLPERRRQGIFRSLLAGISNEARLGDLSRVWIGTVQIPAEKAMRPAGFRAALTFTTLRAAGLHVMVASPAADKNLSLISGARAVLDSRGSSIRMGVSIRRNSHRSH
jgi:GNAT superfamily N-acetyltransferase